MTTFARVRVPPHELVAAPYAAMNVERVFANSVVCKLSVWFETSEYTELIKDPVSMVTLANDTVVYQNGVALAKCTRYAANTPIAVSRDTYFVLGLAADSYIAMDKTVAVIQIVAAGAVLYTAPEQTRQTLAVSCINGGWQTCTL